MAHVGTTSNLKQPAATGSAQRTGLWMAVFAAVVIAAIALAFVMTQLVGSKATHGALGGDLSYDQIEALRGASVPIAADRSYDQIEAQRGTGTYLAPILLDRGADRGGSTQPVPGSLQLKHGFNRDLQP